MLKKIVLTSAFICFSSFSAVIPIDTSLWSYELSPSSGLRSDKDVWTNLGSNTPTKTANSSGSLVSNFVLSEDFVFSGNFIPTFANNASCVKANDNSCNDNDLLGIVFGWQNEQNHFRLGWGQGGINDITGRNGLFLIREINGLSSTLKHWSDIYWQENEEYFFSVERNGNDLAIGLRGRARDSVGTQGINAQETLASPKDIDISYRLTDDSFLSGRIGLYTESQTAVFKMLSAHGTVLVSEPAVGVLLLAGFIFLFFRRYAR